MKKIILLMLFPLICIGQKQGNIWYFGDHAGLDFNNKPPTPLLNGQTYFYPYGWDEGCSSISDSSGSLLFYTNGMKIWNKQQQVMPNGDSLMGNVSSTQSSIIVPLPGSQRYYYVFTTDALENNFQNGLRYSIVDMCLSNDINGYNGDVLSNAKNILLVDTVSERLICIRHSNGTDYWIITHKFNSDAFYALKLTSTGIIDTVISHTGTIDNIGWGQTVISNNGLKIACTSPSLVNGFTLLFDFDPSTGNVLNEQILSTGTRGYGISFSPDNTKLYCSETGVGNVYQYNLNAGSLASIISSKTYLVQNGPDAWRQQKLGPDGKIYLSQSGKTYLSTIEFPDSLGLACNYIDSAIYLGGKIASFGLPNFIFGYDYSNTIVTCKLETGINNIKNIDSTTLSPNPSTTSFTIESSSKIQTIKVFDIIGNEILSFDQLRMTQSETIDVCGFAKGIYFVQITVDSAGSPTKNVVNKKIVVQ